MMESCPGMEKMAEEIGRAHSHTIPSAKERVWEPHLRRWLPHIGGVGRVRRAAFASWFS